MKTYLMHRKSTQHKKTINFLTLAFVLAFTASLCRADVTGTTTTYDITATTLAQVAQGFNQKDGKQTFAATTKWKFNCTSTSAYKTTKHDETGTISTVETLSKAAINVTYTVTLPNWANPGYQNASLAAQTEWLRFVGCVTTHENGHVNILKNENYAPYLTQINNLTATGSGSSLDDATKQADDSIFSQRHTILLSVIADLNTQSANYDSTTNHGATQGATLDTSIK